MKDLAKLLWLPLASLLLQQPAWGSTPMGGAGAEPEKRIPIFYFAFCCPMIPTAEWVQTINVVAPDPPVCSSPEAPKTIPVSCPDGQAQGNDGTKEAEWSVKPAKYSVTEPVYFRSQD